MKLTNAVKAVAIRAALQEALVTGKQIHFDEIGRRLRGCSLFGQGKSWSRRRMVCITVMRIALKETVMYSHCHLAANGLGPNQLCTVAVAFNVRKICRLLFIEKFGCPSRIEDCGMDLYQQYLFITASRSLPALALHSSPSVANLD